MKKKAKKQIKAKKIPVSSKMLDVPQKDLMFWIGQYLLASMVLTSWSDANGCPDRVGDISAIHELEDGSARIEYSAEWYD